jgi:hypothetical protein
MSISQLGSNPCATPFYPPGYTPDNKKKVSDLSFPVIDEKKIGYRTSYFSLFKEQWSSVEPTENKVQVLQEFIEYIERNTKKYKDNCKIIACFTKSLHNFLTWLSKRLTYTDFDKTILQNLDTMDITRTSTDDDRGDQISIYTTWELCKKRDCTIDFPIKNKNDAKNYITYNYNLDVRHSEEWFRNPIDEHYTIKEPSHKEWFSFFYTIKNNLHYYILYRLHNTSTCSFSRLVKYLFLQTIVQDELVD